LSAKEPRIRIAAAEVLQRTGEDPARLREALRPIAVEGDRGSRVQALRLMYELDEAPEELRRLLAPLLAENVDQRVDAVALLAEVGGDVKAYRGVLAEDLALADMSALGRWLVMPRSWRFFRPLVDDPDLRLCVLGCRAVFAEREAGSAEVAAVQALARLLEPERGILPAACEKLFARRPLVAAEGEALGALVRVKEGETYAQKEARELAFSFLSRARDRWGPALAT
jgi:hypothetical protein